MGKAITNEQINEGGSEPFFLTYLSCIITTIKVLYKKPQTICKEIPLFLRPTINAEIFWKGDYKTREALLNSGCKITIEPNDEFKIEE